MSVLDTNLSVQYHHVLSKEDLDRKFGYIDPTTTPHYPVQADVLIGTDSVVGITGHCVCGESATALRKDDSDVALSLMYDVLVSMPCPMVPRPKFAGAIRCPDDASTLV